MARGLNKELMAADFVINFTLLGVSKDLIISETLERYAEMTEASWSSPTRQQCQPKGRDL